MEDIFQKFVANILECHLGKKNVMQHNTEFADEYPHHLSVYPDVELLFHGDPTILLDTKYKEPTIDPSTDDLAQMVLYSNSTRIKKCVLVYPAKMEIPHIT